MLIDTNSVKTPNSSAPELVRSNEEVQERHQSILNMLAKGNAKVRVK